MRRATARFSKLANSWTNYVRSTPSSKRFGVKMTLAFTAWGASAFVERGGVYIQRSPGREAAMQSPSQLFEKDAPKTSVSVRKTNNTHIEGGRQSF
jgi:hypothetical protein